MNGPTCHTCAALIDEEDHFCRQCGAAAGRASLPAVRRSALPVVWQPQISQVVKGAAVMAAGTVGQFIFRRVVSSMLGNGGKKQRAVQIRRPRGDDGMVDEAQVITETIMMRRVRIRRHA